MTRYSSGWPTAQAVTVDREPIGIAETVKCNVFVPIAIVGTAVTAALMVLLLLTQSQLSQISFEISALERELSALERQHEKLLIAHAEAYRPDRIEAYAVETIGMIHPNVDQIRYIQIDTADESRKEPKRESVGDSR